MSDTICAKLLYKKEIDKLFINEDYTIYKKSNNNVSVTFRIDF